MFDGYIDDLIFTNETKYGKDLRAHLQFFIPTRNLDTLIYHTECEYTVGILLRAPEYSFIKQIHRLIGWAWCLATINIEELRLLLLLRCPCHGSLRTRKLEQLQAPYRVGPGGLFMWITNTTHLPDIASTVRKVPHQSHADPISRHRQAVLDIRGATRETGMDLEQASNPPETCRPRRFQFRREQGRQDFVSSKDTVLLAGVFVSRFSGTQH